VHVTDLINDLEPLALGELAMTPDEFAGSTVGEINAMLDGYLRRRETLEDLFIVNCALPTYRAFFGRKAPTYKDLTAHRRRKNPEPHELPPIDPALVAKWKPILTKKEKQ
jgi:hypothetical protein